MIFSGCEHSEKRWVGSCVPCWLHSLHSPVCFSDMICALMLSSLLSGLVICSGRFSGGLSGSSHSPLLSIVVMSVSSFLASCSLIMFFGHFFSPLYWAKFLGVESPF